MEWFLNMIKWRRKWTPLASKVLSTIIHFKPFYRLYHSGHIAERVWHIRAIVLLLLLQGLSVASLSAQMDTLQKAKDLNKAAHYTKAERLLKQYAATHSDVNTLWLYGQTGHWAGHDLRAAKSFRAALAKNPNNLNLRMGYARMLAEADRLNHAQKEINSILSADPKNVEAHQLNATIYYWNGRIKPSHAALDKIFEQFPDNANAAKLNQDIKLNTAPYLSYRAGYLNDDQPMQGISSRVEVGWFRSWLLHPMVQVSDQNFYSGGKWSATLWASAGNQFYFGKSGTRVSIEAGAFKNFSAGADWTGNLTISQKLYHNLSFALTAERRPYLSTMTSTSMELIQNRFAASVTYDKTNSWAAQAAYNYQFFNDKNPIHNAYAWLLSPSLGVSVFSFRIGYSYNFSTTSQSRFTPVKNVTQILTNYDSAAQIKGYYNPYFTPIKQHVHSVIGQVKITPVRILDIGLKANVGFYAETQNPYFYLDKTATDNVFINSGFARQTYLPYTLSASIDIKPSLKFQIGAEYSYNKLFFYNSHNAVIHFTVLFAKK